MTDRNRDQSLGWRRRDMLALGLLAGSGALVGGNGRAIAQTKPAVPPAKPRGQVVVGISQEPTVFNPLMPGIEVDQGVWWQIFSPLWYIDPMGRFVPDLARRGARASPMAALRRRSYLEGQAAQRREMA